MQLNNSLNFFPLFFIIEFTRERIKLSKSFLCHSMCFWMMHILSKFQFFNSYFYWGKTEK